MATLASPQDDSQRDNLVNTYNRLITDETVARPEYVSLDGLAADNKAEVESDESAEDLAMCVTVQFDESGNYQSVTLLYTNAKNRVIRTGDVFRDAQLAGTIADSYSENGYDVEYNPSVDKLYSLMPNHRRQLESYFHPSDHPSNQPQVAEVSVTGGSPTVLQTRNGMPVVSLGDMVIEDEAHVSSMPSVQEPREYSTYVTSTARPQAPVQPPSQRRSLTNPPTAKPAANPSPTVTGNGLPDPTGSATPLLSLGEYDGPKHQYIAKLIKDDVQYPKWWDTARIVPDCHWVDEKFLESSPEEVTLRLDQAYSLYVRGRQAGAVYERKRFLAPSLLILIASILIAFFGSAYGTVLGNRTLNVEPSAPQSVQPSGTRATRPPGI